MTSPWFTLIDVALDAAEASPADALAVRRLRDAIPKGASIPVEPGAKLSRDNPVNQLWLTAREYVRPEDFSGAVRTSSQRTERRRALSPQLASAARLARAYLNSLEDEGAAA